MQKPDSTIAVLTSGGVDSAILVAEMTRRHAAVWPIYVESGLSWEGTELHYLWRFLDIIARPELRPLVVLEVPVGDLYEQHWSTTGRGVPDATTPDEAVYLPGRNLLLLSKAMLWCHLHDVPAIALGILKANPFPDATPRFFDLVERCVNEAVGGSVRIERPFATMSKADVTKLGRGLPLEWSFSCIQPVDDKHCGRCNKCAERQNGFAAAGMDDPTNYA